MHLSLRATAAKLLAGLGLLALVTTTGCAAPEDDGAPSAAKSGVTVTGVTKDEAAAAKLPADIASRGTVRVASGVSFPPMEFFAPDNKTVLGFDADLGKALGEALGVKLEFTNVNFDGIIGGLEAGRYDLAITSMLDKKSRQVKVDFVDYLSSGVAIMTVKGNPWRRAPPATSPPTTSARSASPPAGRPSPSRPTPTRRAPCRRCRAAAPTPWSRST
jgi:polar amino acid transport system substrate-binding protein